MFDTQIVKKILSLIEEHEAILEQYSTSSPAYSIEAYLTLTQLKLLLENPKNLQTRQLITFLSDRWQRIQNTNCQYLHDFQNPANAVCMELAREICSQPNSNSNYLCLLMPGLSKVKPEEYLTSSYLDDLNLRELILDENNTRLINLMDVLDFAQDDGILKYNSLFDGRDKILTFKEINRMLSRHPALRPLVDNLTARVLYKLEGPTVGAALNRLISGLRFGGVNFRRYNHYASEENAAMDANVAIVTFNEYLNTLDGETQSRLMSAEHMERDEFNWVNSKTIGSEWEHLVNPGNYSGSIICVEFIAKHLEDILKNNPYLYDLISYQDNTLETLHQLNDCIAQSSQDLKKGLPTIQNHYCYTDFDQELNKKIIDCLISFKGPLRALEIKFLIQIYETQPDNLFMTQNIKNILRNNRNILQKDTFEKLNEQEKITYAVLNPHTPKFFISTNKRKYEQEATEKNSSKLPRPPGG